VAVTLDQDGPQCLIRLEGEAGVFSAAELKKALLEALASRKELRVNVEQTTELGVTALQLLWAAEHEAKAMGMGWAVAGGVPDAVSSALSDAGFAGFPVATEAKEG